MSFDYINEAFKRLDLLNESMFDTSMDGINKLADFLDTEDEVVRVIDPVANTEEDLQDSYVGKVILNCNVCHSHIFENKEEITIDENGEVNKEEACPYCGEQLGFVIIGEIAPFATETAEQSVEEQPEEETTDDTVVADVDAEEPAELDEAIPAVLGAMAVAAAPVIADKLLDDYNPERDAENRTISQSRATRRAHKSSMQEDFKEVSITTEDQHMEMTSDDNGKVTITTEPITEEAVAEEPAAEVIAPVSAETEEEILTNNEVDETPVEETEVIEEEPVADELDIDFEEVDEEGFNDLGESYLKKIYENVDSFKTTEVSTTDTQLIVEGVIRFNSGVEKKTGFVFEAKDFNSRNQIRFVGTNKHLTEAADAYALVGRVDNKKLFVESLKYNYSIEETPVRGVVRRK